MVPNLVYIYSICELRQILSKLGYHRTKRAYPLPLNNSFIAIQWLVGRKSTVLPNHHHLPYDLRFIFWSFPSR
jgi:hypothetical protein